MKLLCADIGGTAIKIGEVTQTGELLSFSEFPSHAKEGGPALMERLCALFADYHAFDRIGISTAGQVDVQKGEILFANENIPAYTGMPIKKLLEERFSVPVSVENDVNAAAIGEGAFGAAKGDENYLCLTYGTGIGGGVVIGGKLLRGMNGAAGEVGHLVTHRDGLPCACGGKGCYEQYASTTALVREAQKVLPSCDNGKAVFQALHEGNEEINRVIDNWVEEVAVGLSSLIHTLGPSCVVLGGGIFHEEELFARLSKVLEQVTMPSFYKGLRLTRAELGNRAGVLGAAKCAIDGLAGAPSMRRADRQVEDPAEIAGILDACKVCRLGMNDDGVPYVLPMNFGYTQSGEDFTLYFHSAQKGRKVDILARNPLAAFEISRLIGPITGENACNYGNAYECVAGIGYMELVLDEEERLKGLRALMKRQAEREDLPFRKSVLARTLVYRLKAEQMTAKRG